MHKARQKRDRTAFPHVTVEIVHSLPQSFRVRVREAFALFAKVPAEDERKSAWYERSTFASFCSAWRLRLFSAFRACASSRRSSSFLSPIP